MTSIWNDRNRQVYQDILDDDLVQPSGYWEQADPSAIYGLDMEDDEVLMMQEYYHSGDGRRWEVYFVVPMDWHAPPTIWQVVEVIDHPGYLARVAEDGSVVVRSTDGGEWTIPCEEDEDVWHAIERYDEAHGTSLYDDIDEELFDFGEE